MSYSPAAFVKFLARYATLSEEVLQSERDESNSEFRSMLRQLHPEPSRSDASTNGKTAGPPEPVVSQLDGTGDFERNLMSRASSDPGLALKIAQALPTNDAATPGCKVVLLQTVLTNITNKNNWRADKYVELVEAIENLAAYPHLTTIVQQAFARAKIAFQPNEEQTADEEDEVFAEDDPWSDDDVEEHGEDDAVGWDVEDDPNDVAADSLKSKPVRRARNKAGTVWYILTRCAAVIWFTLVTLYGYTWFKEQRKGAQPPQAQNRPPAHRDHPGDDIRVVKDKTPGPTSPKAVNDDPDSELIAIMDELIKLGEPDAAMPEDRRKATLAQLRQKYDALVKRHPKLRDENIDELFKLEEPDSPSPEMLATQPAVSPADQKKGEEALAALIGRLAQYPPSKPVDKNAEEIRELRTAIQAFRQEYPPLAQKEAKRFTAFLARTALPQDTRADMLALASRLVSQGDALPIIAGNDRELISAIKFARTAVSMKSVVADPVFIDLAIRGRLSDETMGLIVPAYFDINRPEWTQGWNGIVQARRTGVPVIAIVNRVMIPSPAFDASDATYNTTILNAQTNGVKVLGYVDCWDTLRTEKTLDAIVAEIESWLGHHSSLDGFFFEHPPDTVTNVLSFRQLTSLIKNSRPDRLVVTYPGKEVPEEYLSVAKVDIVCQLIGPEDPRGYRPPEWVVKYNPRKFAGLLWGLNNPNDLPLIIRHAAAKHIGWLYVTEPENYFGHRSYLTPYWDAQVQAILGLNQEIVKGVAAGRR